MIQEGIFEAIREFEPDSPLLKIKDGMSVEKSIKKEQSISGYEIIKWKNELKQDKNPLGFLNPGGYDLQLYFLIFK